MADKAERKPIPGFPAYEVDTEGNVWSYFRIGKKRELASKPKKLSPDGNTTGNYLRVVLRNGSIKKRFMVHRLVLLAFKGECPEGLIGCHNDGNPQNNSLDNLRYDTYKNNYYDRQKHGRAGVGEKNYGSKFTSQDIYNIRRRLRNGESTRAISKTYTNIAESIGAIANGKSWKHLITPIGIDPGTSGTISVLAYGEEVHVCRLNQTEDVVRNFLASWCKTNPYVMLEKVHSMPGQGVSSTFKFGMNYGFLRGILHGLQIPFCDVTPQKWQDNMECLTGGNKNITKDLAKRLYPEQKVIHATADSLILTAYNYRNHEEEYGKIYATIDDFAEAFVKTRRDIREASEEVDGMQSMPSPEG